MVSFTKKFVKLKLKIIFRFMLRNRTSPFPVSIGGSVVECSPATGAAWVRFAADAYDFIYLYDYPLSETLNNVCRP